MKHATTLVLSALLAAPAIAALPPGFVNWDLDGNGDGSINNASLDMNGALYVPSNYDSSKKYPVVTVLHGMGGGGWDDRHVDSTFTNLTNHAITRGFIVFAPESPSNSGNQWSANNLGKVITLLDRIDDSYTVDTSRSYVTGCSNGGGGVYSIITQYPGRFAAAMPIAGVSPSGVNNTTLSKTPMWLFHGDNDSAVNVRNSRNRVDAIRLVKGETTLTYPGPMVAGTQYWLGSDLASGAPYYADSTAGYFKDPDGLLQYSEYRNWGHVIWPYVWNEEPMYDWMMAQSVPEPNSAIVLTLVSLYAVGRRPRLSSEGR